jgi:hypothetical protein
MALPVTFVAGNVLTAAQLNSNFTYLDSKGVAIFNETQSSGTQGGANVASAWTKRVLNTTVINTITGCSIASSVITLPAGTYLLNAYSPFYAVNGIKIKLRNTSDSTDQAIGGSYEFAASNFVNGNALLTTYFTIAAAKTFEVQYYAQTVRATNGLGFAVSFSVNEVYTTIQIEKVA